MENEELKEKIETPCEKEEKGAKKKCGKKWQEEAEKALAEAEESKRKWYAVTAELPSAYAKPSGATVSRRQKRRDCRALSHWG